MKNEIYYKVIYGFGPDDYIGITADELRKAMRAQVTGEIAFFREGSRAGNTIQSIVPDWGKMLGFNRGYKLTSEDYAQIGHRRLNEVVELLESTKMALSGGPQNTIGPGKAEIGDITKSLTDTLTEN